MPSKTSLLALLVALVALFVVLSQGQIVKTAAVKESAYDRVMRTRTLRCGYFMWRPVLFKDPTTNTMQGIMPEIMDKIAQELSLKVEWVEEVSFSHLFEGFKAGRYDAVCGPLSPSTARAQHADFVVPLGYGFLNAYARIDDKRFDQGVNRINEKDVRITAIEGEMTAAIGPLRFPEAQTIALPNLGDGASTFLQVTTNKADIVLTDAFSAKVFMDSNPGQIREVSGGPIIFLPFTLALPQNDYPLKAMLDHSINYLVQTGYVGNLVKKYGMADNLYLPKISYEKL